MIEHSARYSIKFNLDDEIEREAYEALKEQRGWGKKAFVIRALLHEKGNYDEGTLGRVVSDLSERVKRLEKKGSAEGYAESNAGGESVFTKKEHGLQDRDAELDAYLDGITEFLEELEKNGGT